MNHRQCRGVPLTVVLFVIFAIVGTYGIASHTKLKNKLLRRPDLRWAQRREQFSRLRAASLGSLLETNASAETEAAPTMNDFADLFGLEMTEEKSVASDHTGQVCLLNGKCYDSPADCEGVDCMSICGAESCAADECHEAFCLAFGLNADGSLKASDLEEPLETASTLSVQGNPKSVCLPSGNCYSNPKECVTGGSPVTAAPPGSFLEVSSELLDASSDGQTGDLINPTDCLLICGKEECGSRDCIEPFCDAFALPGEEEQAERKAKLKADLEFEKSLIHSKRGQLCMRSNNCYDNPSQCKGYDCELICGELECGRYECVDFFCEAFGLAETVDPYVCLPNKHCYSSPDQCAEGLDCLLICGANTCGPTDCVSKYCGPFGLLDYEEGGSSSGSGSGDEILPYKVCLNDGGCYQSPDECSDEGDCETICGKDYCGPNDCVDDFCHAFFSKPTRPSTMPTYGLVFELDAETSYMEAEAEARRQALVDALSSSDGSGSSGSGSGSNSDELSGLFYDTIKYREFKSHPAIEPEQYGEIYAWDLSESYMKYKSGPELTLGNEYSFAFWARVGEHDIDDVQDISFLESDGEDILAEIQKDGEHLGFNSASTGNDFRDTGYHFDHWDQWILLVATASAETDPVTEGYGRQVFWIGTEDHPKMKVAGSTDYVACEQSVSSISGYGRGFGQVSKIWIWDRELSHEEIDNLFEVTKMPFFSDMVSATPDDEYVRKPTDGADNGGNDPRNRRRDREEEKEERDGTKETVAPGVPADGIVLEIDAERSRDSQLVVDHQGQGVFTCSPSNTLDDDGLVWYWDLKNAYLELTEGGPYIISDDYTMAFWVKFRSDDANYRTVVSGADDAWVTVGAEGDQIGLYSDRAGEFRDTGATIDASEGWQLVIVTGEASSEASPVGRQMFWIGDYDENVVVPMGSTDRVASGDTLSTFGYSNQGPGYLSKAWIWDRQLTIKEMNALFKNTRPQYIMSNMEAGSGSGSSDSGSGDDDDDDDDSDDGSSASDGSEDSDDDDDDDDSATGSDDEDEEDKRNDRPTRQFMEVQAKDQVVSKFGWRRISSSIV